MKLVSTISVIFLIFNGHCFAQENIELDNNDNSRFYMANIMHSNLTIERIWIACAGVFISENYILTAASCVKDEIEGVSHVGVSSGENRVWLSGSGTPHFIREVHLHPKFNASRPLENNIAVFKVDDFRSLEIQPRSLGQITPNRFCTVLGWEGYQSGLLKASPLQMIPVAIVNSTMCSEDSSQIYCTRQTNLTSSFQNCGGLTGAPLFCNGEDEVAGIVVRDHFCAGAQPVGASFISVGDFKEWIEEVIKKNGGESLKVSMVLLMAIFVKSFL
jgi:secreted trypsin-like serine protease